MCRLSAALMQIAAIFSAIACVCYSQLTVYPSGWFIIMPYRQVPVGVNDEAPILYAQCRIHTSQGAPLLRLLVLLSCLIETEDWCFFYKDLGRFLKKKKRKKEKRKKENEAHIGWRCVVPRGNKGGVCSAGVSEDEIVLPLRQMEGCWGAGREGGRVLVGGVMGAGSGGDIFLRRRSTAVSGEAATSSHLTHNPI